MKPAEPATSRTSARPNWTRATSAPCANESRPIWPRPNPPASRTSRNTMAPISHVPDVGLRRRHVCVDDQSHDGDRDDGADRDGDSSSNRRAIGAPIHERQQSERSEQDRGDPDQRPQSEDRKSTRLNSSHITISYAVFCLKKKKKKKNTRTNNKKKVNVQCGRK